VPQDRNEIIYLFILFIILKKYYLFIYYYLAGVIDCLGRLRTSLLRSRRRNGRSFSFVVAARV